MSKDFTSLAELNEFMDWFESEFDDKYFTVREDDSAYLYLNGKKQAVVRGDKDTYLKARELLNAS